jgi:hypothetical protein
MGQIGSIAATMGQMSLNYSESLLKDVKADRAGRLGVAGGKAVDSNHPVFVLGHLSLYASNILEFVGKPKGTTARPAGWEDLFKAGVKCEDDPTGKKYPGLETVTKFYFDAYRTAIAAVKETEDAVFAKPNPAGGRFTEMFPTVGDAVMFLLSGHTMSHLGQFSAWRRIEGLAPAN